MAGNGPTPVTEALSRLPSGELLAAGLLSLQFLLRRTLDKELTLKPSERESITNVLAVLENIHLRWYK